MRAAWLLRTVLPLGAAAMLHARAHGAEVPPAAAASAPAVVQLPTVTIGAGSGTEGFRSPPQHAYAIDADTLGQQPATALADVLAQHLPGVALTHEQGNALQPTLHFNGFAASPVLGTPQGLSVFQDGVRVNEPFGDVVNWDLIPTEALRSIHLVPITDPVFGLNTLGGAVLLRTRDGRSAPGARRAWSSAASGAPPSTRATAAMPATGAHSSPCATSMTAALCRTPPAAAAICLPSSRAATRATTSTSATPSRKATWPARRRCPWSG
ncbi:Plug domain-containing protein [Thiomonas sp. FB-Cd]|uniref:TonB-dependent receptor plug domain-containing protein n=1 Tax=Thiomonas sp. FB-Cd TaxID=1158292 RepID=UPI000AD2F070|nr:Plug domain-containing protein [Thiomonas sp. FB-Cd]